MITHLNIKNFATIAETEVEFHGGLNILTGESGAGKSVLIQALSLALGARADSTFVRTGQDKAVVQLVADVHNQDIVLTREVSSTGKNICKVNGELVTRAELSNYAQKIADIHGQYDQQSLLKLENHLHLVDLFEKEAISPAKQKVEELYQEYTEAKKKYLELEEMAKDNDRQRELLEFEIKEIQEAALVLGEDVILEEDLIRLKNREKIHACLQHTYDLAYGREDSTMEALSSVLTAIRDATHISKDAADLEDEFSEIYYRFEDACRHLREATDSCIYSQEEIDMVDDRLYLINQLKKKYGDTIDAILDRGEKQEKALHQLHNIDAELESLYLEQSSLEDLLKNETQRLTQLRRSSARTLERKIQEELDQLHFQHAELFIEFKSLDAPTPNGQDRVEFLISTNKGEELKPLSKIASGGEMSRIMLAFKKIIGDYDKIPTMIFDEIDSGISGEAAGVVGNALGDLAQNHQVISITHLPQIAACGDHNYQILKSTDDENTYTTVEYLSEEEKIVEIARLIAGMKISDLTIKSAKEMIAMAK